MLAGASSASRPGWVFSATSTPPRSGLRAEIDAATRQGLLGNDVLGSGRHCRHQFTSRRAATSSARRRRCSSAWRATAGEPRNKPPFPGIHGLWGQPTLINNVETFADVPVILDRGADVVEGQGVPVAPA